MTIEHISIKVRAGPCDSERSKARASLMIFKKSLTDTSWAERGGSVAWRVGLTTFGILALELALIRWTSSQIRIFAYFNNVVLICAFFGAGPGVALGRRH